MIRSLFTGISGLRAHQQMLDVTANNIANVNTTGFKSSSTVFEDTLSQTVSGASAATATNGGTNGLQVGLGVRLAATQTNLTEGSSQFTGRGSDVRINGDGFFVLSKGGQTTYSRAGAFSLDSDSNLTSPDGSKVQSAAGGDLNLSALKTDGYISWSISPLGDVNGVKPDGTTTVLGTIGMATFANPGGLTKVGETQFSATTNSGPAVLGTAGTNGLGNMTSGYLEMSNVDLASELTNLIISERGFQANSRVITTSDEVLQSLISLKN